MSFAAVEAYLCPIDRRITKRGNCAPIRETDEDEILQTEGDITSTLQTFERLTSDPDVRDLLAETCAPGEWWVSVTLAERLCGTELEMVFRQLIETALLSVEGVHDLVIIDPCTWWLTGTRSGEALLRAAGAVVDRFASLAKDLSSGSY